MHIPVIGWIARDVAFGDRDNRIWFGVLVGALWVFSVAAWGVFALLVPFTLAIPAAIVLVYTLLVWNHDRKRAARAARSAARGTRSPRRAA